MQLSAWPAMQHMMRPVVPLGCEQADLSSHRSTPAFHAGTSTATLQPVSSWHSVQHASWEWWDPWSEVRFSSTFRRSSFMQSSPGWNEHVPGGGGGAGGNAAAQIGDARCARSAGTSSGDGVVPPCVHHGAAGGAAREVEPRRERSARHSAGTIIAIWCATISREMAAGRPSTRSPAAGQIMTLRNDAEMISAQTDNAFNRYGLGGVAGAGGALRSSYWARSQTARAAKPAAAASLRPALCLERAKRACARSQIVSPRVVVCLESRTYTGAPPLRPVRPRPAALRPASCPNRVCASQREELNAASSLFS